MNNEEIISHHGILGQRWGIRRFQNPDGSLTAAGRRRAQKLKGEYKALTGKKLKGKIPNEDPSKKKVRELSDTELSGRIKRLTNEKQALSLESDLSPRGKKVIRTIGKEVLAPALIEAGKNSLTKFFTKHMSNYLGVGEKDVKDGLSEIEKEAQKAKAEYEKEKFTQELDKLKKNKDKPKDPKEPKESNNKKNGDNYSFNTNNSYTNYNSLTIKLDQASSDTYSGFTRNGQKFLGEAIISDNKERK